MGINAQNRHAMNDLLPLLILAALIWLVWRMFAGGKKVSADSVAQVDVEPQPEREDPQSRHIRSALFFAKTQHRELAQKAREHAAWERNYGLAQVHELDNLGGVEFEKYLAGLFRKQGYEAELTPSTGDYGADLVLSKEGKRIAVQAKRYVGSVGVSAVQEALSGMAYYKCHSAWVVTTGTFTPNALELAEKSNARLISRTELGTLIVRAAEINGGTP